MAPVSQQNTTGHPVLIFHVDPLALAWGEDGVPFLLCFAQLLYQKVPSLSRVIFRDYPVYFKRGRAERAGLLPAPAFSEAPKKSGVSSQIRQSTDWLFILHNTDMEFLFTESYTHFPQGYPQPVWKTPALQPGSVGLWRGRAPALAAVAGVVVGMWIAG